MSTSKSRKREAIALAACDRCKSSKVRCVQEDGQDKCARCTKKGAECSFITLRQTSGWVSAGGAAVGQSTSLIVAPVAAPAPAIPAQDMMNDLMARGDIQMTLLASSAVYLGTMPDPISPYRAVDCLERAGRRIENITSANQRAFVLSQLALGARVHQSTVDDFLNDDARGRLALTAPSYLRQWADNSSTRAKSALGVGMFDMDADRAPALFVLIFTNLLSGEWPEARAALGACINSLLQFDSELDGAKDGWHCTVICLDIMLALELDKTPFLGLHHIARNLVPLSVEVPTSDPMSAFGVMVSHLFTVGHQMAVRRIASAERPEDRASFDEIMRICTKVFDVCDLLEVTHAQLSLSEAMLSVPFPRPPKNPLHMLGIVRSIASKLIVFVFRRTHRQQPSIIYELGLVASPVEPGLYEPEAVRAARLCINVLRYTGQGLGLNGSPSPNCSMPPLMIHRGLDTLGEILASAPEVLCPLNDKIELIAALIASLNYRVTAWPNYLGQIQRLQTMSDQLVVAQAQQATPASTGSSDQSSFFDLDTDMNLGFDMPMPTHPDGPFKTETFAMFDPYQFDSY